MNPAAGDFSRLILFRSRPEFALPAAWVDWEWIPLGELRPLLQAISPVRDLSDLWRWAATPLPREAVEAVLAGLPVIVDGEAQFHRRGTETAERSDIDGALARALLVPAEAAGAVERVELSPVDGRLLGLASPAAMAGMLAVAAALRRACGTVAVGV